MKKDILSYPEVRRKSFAKRRTLIDMPDLVELPKSSYAAFL